MKHLNLINAPVNGGNKKESTGYVDVLPDRPWYHCIARANSIVVRVYEREWHEGKKLWEKTLLLADDNGDILGTPVPSPTRLSTAINAVIRPYIPHSDYIYLGGDIKNIPDKPFKQICNKLLWEWVEDVKEKYADGRMDSTKKIPPVIEGMKQVGTFLDKHFNKVDNTDVASLDADWDTRHVFGKNVYFLRKKHKLTQGALADKIGLSHNAIKLWEKNQNKPRIPSIKIIADFFKVPFYEIITKDLSIKPKMETKTMHKKIAVTDEQLANFANNLKFLRLSKGEAQTTLAKNLGFSHSLPGQWESCNKLFRPSGKSLEKVANYFNVLAFDMLNTNMGDPSTLPPVSWVPGKRGKNKSKEDAAPKRKYVSNNRKSKNGLTDAERDILMKNLEYLRLKKQLPKHDLSIQAGYHPTMVGQWSRKKWLPSKEAVTKVAKVLGVSYEDIITKNLVGADAEALPKLPIKSSGQKRGAYKKKSTNKHFTNEQIKNFRENILILRKNQKKGQNELGKDMGVSGSLVSLLENNGEVTMDKVAMMAKALGTSMDTLTNKRLSSKPLAKKTRKPWTRKPYVSPKVDNTLRTPAEKAALAMRDVISTPPAPESFKSYADQHEYLSLAEKRRKDHDAVMAIKEMYSNSLKHLGWGEEQIKKAINARYIDKEDAEAVILGMATKFGIDLHVGKKEMMPPMDATYQKIIKEHETAAHEQFKIISELQEKIIALTDENKSLRFAPVHTAENGKLTPYRILLNVKENYFGSSDRFVTLMIDNSGGFTLDDPKNRITVNGISKI